ncbi:MAG: hypothetical protein CME65_00800 [Halobacteriovoraceae bacterium]|nr:hypothetical protein [Halobacteriovoraceae bacterium]|tara:strand:- start:1615 stop:4557 length:2943 start_codon:yes stop_codon:yes gene_type:complete
MKLILLALLFTSNLLAADFYVYHPVDQSIHGGKTIYSKHELKSLQNLGIHYQVSRISSDKNIKDLKAKYPNYKLEPVQNIEFYDYRSYQWYLNNPGGVITRRITDIDTQEIQAVAGEDIQNLHDTSEQTTKIRVAVIDSGVDISHPELRHLIVKKDEECQLLQEYKQCLSDRSRENSECHQDFATRDSDGDGYPLDCHGWSVTNSSYPGVEVTGNPEMDDQIGHGTHIAGLIAAPKDGTGINGISDNVEILPVQVAMNSATDNPIDNIAKGVLYALKNGAKVINLSLGWRFQFETTLMRDMIRLANQQGVAVIVAAGNDAHSDISYPCAYDDVICVGAHDQTGKLASFSNRGTSVDLIAPGVDILSTWPTQIRSRLFTQDYNYEFMSGTSQAAPLVSGMVAKLMSRGFSANQAKIKLFKGARDKKEKSDIRFGNVDYKKALSAKPDYFLYPAHKEAALILYKTEAENNIRIKIKNLGQTQTQIPVELISSSSDIIVQNSQKTIAQIDSNETIEIDFGLTIQSYLESEQRFTLKLRDDEFIVRANIVRVIRPNLKEDEQVQIESLEGDLGQNTILRPFEQITEPSSRPDFLAVTTENNTSSIAILAFDGEEYKLGRKLTLRDVNPVFLNFSKLDVDIDGSQDYIVTYVVTDRDGNKTSKFIAFKEDLTPKRIFIAPNNQYDNKKTFLPGKFKWLKKSDRFVPYWIGFGENGTETPASPWEPARNPTSNYVYYLDPELGLQNESINEEIIPLHFLYQSKQELAAGRAFFIGSEGVGFLKNYILFEVYNGVISQTNVELNQFFDLFEPRPLPLVDLSETHSSHGFFNESSNGGSQLIFKTYLQDKNLRSELIRLSNIFENENIKFVKTVGENTVFYQTDHKIAVFDRESESHFYRESKVNATRRRFEPISHFEGLYLPAREAPNFTSEVFRYIPDRGIVSLASFRTLAIGGCESIGKIASNDSESLAFVCAAENQIIFLPLSL